MAIAKTDPNIGNEAGHTIYPKWITNKDGNRIVVNDADEEKATLSGKEAPLKKEPDAINKPSKGWTA